LFTARLALKLAGKSVRMSAGVSVKPTKSVEELQQVAASLRFRLGQATKRRDQAEERVRQLQTASEQFLRDLDTLVHMWGSAIGVDFRVETPPAPS
jgi:hypothetical protein